MLPTRKDAELSSRPTRTRTHVAITAPKFVRALDAAGRRSHVKYTPLWTFAIPLIENDLRSGRSFVKQAGRLSKAKGVQPTERAPYVIR